MPSSRPRVGVVALNWRKPEMTAECVESVIADGYENLDVVIVDNGSGDGSERLLAERFPDLTVVATGENLGFSRGCNAGIRVAIERGAEFVALVNNDLVVEPGSIGHAVDVLLQDPRAGAVTGKIYTNDDGVLWQAGGHIDNRLVSGIARGRLETDTGQYDAQEETGWASGAMSVFRADVLAREGLLPEEYFFGQEEWDISTAILRSGMSIVYDPQFVGRHRVGGSYGSHPGLNSYGGTRNRHLYAEKYLSPLACRAWKVVFRVYAHTRMPRQLVSIHGEEAAPAHIRGVQLACRRHRPGEPVTLDELQEISRDLAVATSWESRE